MLLCVLASGKRHQGEINPHLPPIKNKERNHNFEWKNPNNKRRMPKKYKIYPQLRIHLHGLYMISVIGVDYKNKHRFLLLFKFYLHIILSFIGKILTFIKFLWNVNMSTGKCYNKFVWNRSSKRRIFIEFSVNYKDHYGNN